VRPTGWGSAGRTDNKGRCVGKTGCRVEPHPSGEPVRRGRGPGAV